METTTSCSQASCRRLSPSAVCAKRAWINPLRSWKQFARRCLISTTCRSPPPWLSSRDPSIGPAPPVQRNDSCDADHPSSQRTVDDEPRRRPANRVAAPPVDAQPRSPVCLGFRPYVRMVGTIFPRLYFPELAQTRKYSTVRRQHIGYDPKGYYAGSGGHDKRNCRDLGGNSKRGGILFAVHFAGRRIRSCVWWNGTSVIIGTVSERLGGRDRRPGAEDTGLP